MERVNFCYWFQKFIARQINALDATFLAMRYGFISVGMSIFKTPVTGHSQIRAKKLKPVTKPKDVSLVCHFQKKNCWSFFFFFFFFKTSINPEQYYEITQQFIAMLELSERYLWFQEDNATAHTSQATLKVFQWATNFSRFVASQVARYVPARLFSVGIHQGQGFHEETEHHRWIKSANRRPHRWNFCEKCWKRCFRTRNAGLKLVWKMKEVILNTFCNIWKKNFSQIFCIIISSGRLRRSWITLYIYTKSITIPILLFTSTPRHWKLRTFTLMRLFEWVATELYLLLPKRLKYVRVSQPIFIARRR